MVAEARPGATGGSAPVDKPAPPTRTCVPEGQTNTGAVSFKNNHLFVVSLAGVPALRECASALHGPGEAAVHGKPEMTCKQNIPRRFPSAAEPPAGVDERLSDKARTLRGLGEV